MADDGNSTNEIGSRNEGTRKYICQKEEITVKKIHKHKYYNEANKNVYLECVVYTGTRYGQ